MVIFGLFEFILTDFVVLVTSQLTFVLAKKITQKQNKLLTFKGKKTDESLLIEKEIVDADDKIDQLVYKIYSITEEEKKVIEESIK